MSAPPDTSLVNRIAFFQIEDADPQLAYSVDVQGARTDRIFPMMGILMAGA
jgi:hypothetical protein